MPEPIRYRVDLTDRLQHLVRVTLTVPADLSSGGRVVLPVWTPGSYVVRDYVRHVQWIEARTSGGTQRPSGHEVELVTDGLNAWRLPNGIDGPVEITLELYANDLTVRTNHVDDHHALIIPAATFPYLEGAEDRPHQVTIPPTPAGHRVWSLLAPHPHEPETYQADNRDHLIDAAFEVGNFPNVEFEVDGVPHHLVWAGHGGRPDLQALAKDAAAIARVSQEVVAQALPVERYTMLLVGWDRSGGGGGLEHRDGAVLQLPVHAFQDEDLSARARSLIAHEYFHLWNVKRLVPEALVRPDYERPTRSPSLWVAEGWTSYYDKLLPVRAGVWSPQRLLDALGDVRGQVDRSYGATLQSLRQASMDAWVKHYVRDENAPNAMTDYYGHGSLVAFELDLRLRQRRPESDGLDDVFRLLWTRHAKTAVGYSEVDVLDAVATVGDDELAQLVDTRVGTAGRPVLDDVVAVVGLRWVAPDEPATPWLGVQAQDRDDEVVLAQVLRGGPAWEAGLTGGDRLVAIDGVTVGRGELELALRARQPDDEITVTVQRGPRLISRTVVLDDPQPTLRLEVDDDADDAARAAFSRWASQPWPGASR